MNVASLENCKRLYELSGWGNKLGETDFYAVNKKGEQVAFVREGQVIGELSLGEWDKSIPAYPLGYLLRKLVELTTQYNTKLYYSITEKRWRCSYYGYDLGSTADTPEDASCRLAIKLFEEGILKR